MQEDLVMITSSFNLKECRAFQNGLFHIEDMSCYNAVKVLDVDSAKTSQHYLFRKPYTTY